MRIRAFAIGVALLVLDRTAHASSTHLCVTHDGTKYSLDDGSGPVPHETLTLEVDVPVELGLDPDSTRFQQPEAGPPPPPRYDGGGATTSSSSGGVDASSSHPTTADAGASPPAAPSDDGGGSSTGAGASGLGITIALGFPGSRRARRK